LIYFSLSTRSPLPWDFAVSDWNKPPSILSQAHLLPSLSIMFPYLPLVQTGFPATSSCLVLHTPRTSPQKAITGAGSLSPNPVTRTPSAFGAAVSLKQLTFTTSATSSGSSYGRISYSHAVTTRQTTSSAPLSNRKLSLKSVESCIIQVWF
jgi:hypothetical protein